MCARKGGTAGWMAAQELLVLEALYIFAGCDVEWIRRHSLCCMVGRTWRHSNSVGLDRDEETLQLDGCCLNDTESEIIIAAGCEGAEQLDAGRMRKRCCYRMAD